MNYVELQVTSNFSFLRGASHPHELVYQAAEYGYCEIAITDRNTMAGIVRAHTAAKEKGMRLIVGCRLDLVDGPGLLAYPVNKQGYAQLCALLTKGNLRTEKGKCELYKADVFAHAGDIKFVIVPPDQLGKRFHFGDSFTRSVQIYRAALGADLYLAATCLYQGQDQKRLYRLKELAELTGVQLVATNDVHYHHPARGPLQDVVTCIREQCTIYEAGFRLQPNNERFLKPPGEMARLFYKYPDAIHRAQEIADACRFTLDCLEYIYPEEITSEGRTTQQELEFLSWRGAREHYGEQVPEKITASIRHELAFIEQMNYAPYFLTVFDIVRFARSKGILCQGRGSAANSTICYVLGITAVDPTKFDLFFERFASSARAEPPDIDVDFEHERREEVIQYIYRKYGRDRAAIVATVTQQHQKGAVRDVGKAMGLSVDTVNRLSKCVWEYTIGSFEFKRLQEQGLNPDDPHLQQVVQLVYQYMGFPRQLGQHTGGFVITQGKLTDLCPVLNARMENRTTLEWNKDDIEALHFLKIDVLALGMLTCIRKAFTLAKDHYGLSLTLANIPADDPAVYAMISKGDTIGVFQIESRAQQSMLPRMKPTNFYDLVIEVAIVRPGPIQGGMVHPYLRRRNNEEPVEYPSKELEQILGKTLGVPLFQEQAMRIAVTAAGFTAAEADALRRNMATFKLNGQVSQFQEKLISGMVRNGYTPEYALRIYKQLEGFGSYGFPESHAASFAQLVYVSAWLKCHYPEVFACALLNSYPMGFYAPAQILYDARNHGVTVRHVDINHSLWDNSLEEQVGGFKALRLGFRQIRGIREKDIAILIASRGTGYTSIHALRQAGVSQSTIEKLADADAFRSLGIDRRRALWEVSSLADLPTALFSGMPSESEYEHFPNLPEMSESEHVVQDYRSIGLSLKAHPVSFGRAKLKMLGVVTAKDLTTSPDGALVNVAGLVLVKQRPETASGVCFITLEDETGTINLIVFPSLFDRYYKEIQVAVMLMVSGKLQKEHGVTHVIVQQCYDLSRLLPKIADPATEVTKMAGTSKHQQGNFFDTENQAGQTEGQQNRVFHNPRNFK